MKQLEEYDGTTAVVRTEHLPAEEVEFMRWKAERWMKVLHIPIAFRHDPRFVLFQGMEDVGPHLPGKLDPLCAWTGKREESV